jgi:Holliday junction resolvase RusA-like endonuclease
MQIAFVIPGRIRGKGRPRARVRSIGGRAFAHMHTDAKTRSAETMVRDFAALAMRGRNLLDGPLALEITIHVSIPQSWSKRARLAAKWVTGKPDPDNAIKLIADALNGIVYRDDTQIARIIFARMYIRDGSQERAEITVAQLSDAIALALGAAA